KNFAEGKISEVKKASEYRIDPFWSHFGICGGCKWQHMTYESQLKFKEQYVGNALSRIGKVDVSGMEPILGSAQTEYYRNKLEYTFSNKRLLNSLDVDHPAYCMDAVCLHVSGKFRIF